MHKCMQVWNLWSINKFIIIFFLDFMVDFSNQLHLYHEKTIKSLNIFHKATSSIRFKSTFICIYYESTFISGNAVVSNSTFVW